MEAEREKKGRKHNKAWDIWDIVKLSNICIIVTPERREREHRTQEIFEDIVAKNIPKLLKTLTHRFKKLSNFKLGENEIITV